MLIGTIYNQLVTTLQNDSSLKDYIKTFFRGVRFDVAKENHPCLMIDVARNNEIEKDFGQIKRIWAEFDVLGFVYEYDQESLITGNPSKEVYGILDIENDIRAVLQSSNTLGDRIIDLQMNPTEFDYTFWPVRGLRIRVRTLYQQTDGV